MYGRGCRPRGPWAAPPAPRLAPAAFAPAPPARASGFAHGRSMGALSELRLTLYFEFLVTSTLRIKRSVTNSNESKIFDYDFVCLNVARGLWLVINESLDLLLLTMLFETSAISTEFCTFAYRFCLLRVCPQEPSLAVHLGAATRRSIRDFARSDLSV